jgi:hypothetical protein
VLQLALHEEAVGASEASLLRENLCNLLALAIASNPGSQDRRPEIQLEEVLAFCCVLFGS